MTFSLPHCRARLHDTQAQGLQRTATPRQSMDTQDPTRLRYNNRVYLQFCSNNYLGLAAHSAVIAAFSESAHTYGVGSGSARVMTGETPYHTALESALADFMGYPAATLFSNGYMANLGVLSTFIPKTGVLFQDKQNHASLWDAAHLSPAPCRRYRHLDTTHLARYLERQHGQYTERTIVTGGVFSVNGATAPLDTLIALSQQYQTSLIVDDAHGIGVLGQNGRGTLEHYNSDPASVTLVIGTLGKAFGTFGAFVVGSQTHIAFLRQYARPHMYTTALPPALAAASLASLSLIQKEHWRREKLHENRVFFQTHAKKMGITLQHHSPSAIQGITVPGGPHVANQWVQALKEKGIWTYAFRPPSVPQGTAVLRVSLCTQHSHEEIRVLLETIDAQRI